MTKSLTVSIASQEAVVKRVDELKRRDDDIKGRLGPLLRKLWVTERRLATGAEASVFDELDLRFPNFAQVTDELRMAAMLSRKIGAPFKPNRILLGGPPGLGKTTYAKVAGDLMGLHYAELSMPTVTANFELAGSSIQWGNGSPGWFAKALIESPVANPVILLDEVDKMVEGNYDPTGPLYSILEDRTASGFHDMALELDLDMSHIVWMATANEIGNIPRPIFDRMQYFEIRVPTRGEMVAIVASIYSDLLGRDAYRSLLEEKLPEETVMKLSTHRPREVRKLLLSACNRAITRESRTVMARDIVMKTEPPARRIGFI